MRITLIRQKYNPFGGAERFVSRALAALGANAASVSLIARAWEPIENVNFIQCKPFYIGRLWRDFGFSCKARQQLKTIQSDLVQSHERIPGCDIFRAGDGVHRVWLEQRSRTLGFFSRLFMQLSPYHAYLLMTEKRLFEHPKLRAVICNSNMVKNEIVEHFHIDESKLHVIYNGIDTAEFHPAIKQNKLELRNKIGISVDKTVFLFVGSGYARKGLSQVLQALTALPENAVLIIVGYDKNEKSFRRQAEKLGLLSRVIFRGPQKNVKDSYAVADVFILPTLYDPFPNAVVEAMACGLPVITSRKSGAAEVITDYQNGFVCDALDTEKMSRSMQILCDKNLAGRMGLNARKTAESFDIAMATNSLVNLYKELLSDQSSRT